MFIFAALLAVHVGLAGTIPTAPENITVTFINPQSVRISWQIAANLFRRPIEKYIVTFKPTNDRVIQQVAGNSEAVVLDNLLPNTQYQLSVTAVSSGHRYKSRQVTFKTLESAKGEPMPPHTGNGIVVGASSEVILTTATNIPSPNSTTRGLPTVRGVEVGIVLVVLLVWAGAIALFFNRWGKIRMLLPYQPDYKQEQLKVPGTGVCTGGACNGQHSHQIDEGDSVSSQRKITVGYLQLLQKVEDDFVDDSATESGKSECEGSEVGSLVKPQTKLRHFHCISDEPSTTIAERCARNRINSAIFVSSEGRGFDSIEFLRRHGSQSVLCRKARSAENISDETRKRRFSQNQQWTTEDSNHPSETIELVECHAAPSARNSSVTSVTLTTTPSKIAAATASAIATAINRANSIVGSISIEPSPQIVEQQQEEEESQNSNVSITQKPIAQIAASANSNSSSPVRLSLKTTTKSPVSTLPTLSISQPSPPPEGEVL